MLHLGLISVTKGFIFMLQKHIICSKPSQLNSVEALNMPEFFFLSLLLLLVIIKKVGIKVSITKKKKFLEARIHKAKSMKRRKEQYGNKSRKTMVLKASLNYTWSQDDGMEPQKK